MGGGPDRKPEHLLVILPFPEPTEIFDRIRKNYPHIKITFRMLLFTDSPWEGREEIPKELYHDATILATLSALPPSPEDCPNLHLIHVFSAGTNHIQSSPIYTSTSIPLTTSSGIHGPQISEWVLLTALVHSHHYNKLHDLQRAHKWGTDPDPSEGMRSMHDNVGQRLGVLGYGSIGRQVGRVSQAMGMDVIAYTASARSTPEAKKDHGFIVPGTGDPDGSIPSAWYSGMDKASLHRFLSQDIDHLLVSVPLTKQTTHFLGAEEFAILGKRRAFVSNISRGQILDQDALIAALEKGADKEAEGGLRGAALDVTDPEPLPQDHPLWEAPNCIITPHVSGLGTAYVDRAFQVLELNLERMERGEELINLVDRKRGY
ncbi:NAD(P)-binding domain [Lasallia pustulata]|uniref:NAD(P)-binding domain n=1 Tax=Lasallia pustulata TaxID=136370 RepID=A0A1W5D7K7_9LECA|nr:NAD(P)-binding domain [Lasallia pustulata]